MKSMHSNQDSNSNPARQVTVAIAVLSLAFVCESTLSSLQQGSAGSAPRMQHSLHGASLANVKPAQVASGDLCEQHQTVYGVTSDEQKAFQYCSMAANDGNRDAQFELGVMYLEGVGIEPDEELAIEWLSRASRQGHEQADRLLEYVFENDFSLGC